jgi:hypothetical protein
MWKEDSKIDEVNLGEKSRNIPQLHAKYLKFLSVERITLKKLRYETDKVRQEQLEYYNGRMPSQRMVELGLMPFPHKILKSEINDYLSTDDRVIEMNVKLAEQEEKVEVLSSIIDSINRMGFAIKNTIDWLRFTNGAIM